MKIFIITFLIASPVIVILLRQAAIWLANKRLKGWIEEEKE